MLFLHANYHQEGAFQSTNISNILRYTKVIPYFFLTFDADINRDKATFRLVFPTWMHPRGDVDFN